MGAGKPKSRRESPTSRSYVTQHVKAASHPARSEILKALKEEPRSAPELEELTGRSRYDLYHHLGVLEENGLISHRMREGRTKEFFTAERTKPDVVVIDFNRDELKEHPVEFRAVLDALSKMEGIDIRHRNKIRGLKVIISYEGADQG